VYVLPCIAGHVGADAAAVVLSEGPHLQDDNWLIVDVGTNAEIVLGSKDRLLACSSPTGPAFEGAQISCGQRAAPGAIERLRIDRETLQPRFRVIGSGLWSDEPGFEEAIARTGVTGICGSGIIEALAEMFLAGIINQDGVIDGAMAAKCPLVQPEGRTFSYLIRDGEPVIRVTQNDVRQIQLAKGALYAGAQLLMDQMGVESVDRITLAGAFGSHIDVKYAMVLGMIPDCDLSKVVSAGNAASTGARIALLNSAARREIERLVRDIEKVETAVEPRFQEHFVGAMGFPHSSAPFPMLAREIDLPAPKAANAGGEEGGGRRRRRREKA
ncbi:MAG: ASKHA domain-containing protein, partial [Hyphomicrobiales bacterium]